MVEPDESPADQPVLQPRLVRFLRKRPKLVEFEMREEFLEHLEQNIRERRKPGTVAQRLSRTVEDASEPVIRDTLRRRLEKANDSLLRRL